MHKEKKSDVMYLKVERDVMILESEVGHLVKRTSRWWPVEFQLSKIWQYLFLCNITLIMKD